MSSLTFIDVDLGRCPPEFGHGGLPARYRLLEAVRLQRLEGVAPPAGRAPDHGGAVAVAKPAVGRRGRRPVLVVVGVVVGVVVVQRGTLLQDLVPETGTDLVETGGVEGGGRTRCRHAVRPLNLEDGVRVRGGGGGGEGVKGASTTGSVGGG